MKVGAKVGVKIEAARQRPHSRVKTSVKLSRSFSRAIRTTAWNLTDFLRQTSRPPAQEKTPLLNHPVSTGLYSEMRHSAAVQSKDSRSDGEKTSKSNWGGNRMQGIDATRARTLLTMRRLKTTLRWTLLERSIGAPSGRVPKAPCVSGRGLGPWRNRPAQLERQSSVDQGAPSPVRGQHIERGLPTDLPRTDMRHGRSKRASSAGAIR